ncbi:hypothetical protein TRFO_27596 [Tritrichomonas foetus]|uniref:Uncharacterized protein n=1 Tax=Tritrichomonas foetus TaxID=1144522 RepID=A0A1J4K201_9EUKA|nr:hypothetical protein TRFO_27596 [Tritrichomonas foetus]|eukprot:OHT04816.1 hypothetical protein TRFO_27596 [Tritrichomonas foetus]
MDIGGDQVASRSTRTRTITVVITVLLFAIAGCYFASQYGFSKKIHRKPTFFEKPPVDLSDTEISIFILGDSKEAPKPDLRTKFWEHQISDIGKNISVHYIADGPGLPGKWVIPSAIQEGNKDPGYCERNLESWKIFSVNEKSKRWYFQAHQDTYINIERLLSLIGQLDKKINPMNQIYFQYAGSESPESNHAVIPEASSGWLISNAALRALFNNMYHFSFSCSKFGEEIAFGQMILNMRYEVEDFINPHFIANWPNETLEVLGKEGDQLVDKIQKCPSKQFRFSQQVEMPFDQPGTFIATTLPNVPMDQVSTLLQDINLDLQIGYPEENKPIFCWA